MSNILAAVRLVLGDLSGLSKPAVASAIAGVVVPLAAGLAGVAITPAEVGGWLALAGSVAAILQKLAAVRAPAPAPVAKSKG